MREEMRQEQSGSTALTDRLRAGEASPFVVLCIFGLSKSTGETMGAKAMGFVCELLGRNLKLVVTCKHVFLGFSRITEIVAVLHNPQLNRVEVIGSAIPDSSPGSDIAFLVVRDTTGAHTHPFALTEGDPPCLSRPTYLYNVSSWEADPLQGVYTPFFTQQLVPPETHVAFDALGGQQDVLVRIRDFRAQAHWRARGLIQHRLFRMQARPGCSGGPTWDGRLRLYGLNVGATVPGLESYAVLGNITLCLPVSQLYAARQRIARQLRQRLGGPG